MFAMGAYYGQGDEIIIPSFLCKLQQDFQQPQALLFPNLNYCWLPAVADFEKN
jgi:hypothetical protein